MVFAQKAKPKEKSFWPEPEARAFENSQEFFLIGFLIRYFHYWRKKETIDFVVSVTCGCNNPRTHLKCCSLSILDFSES